MDLTVGTETHGDVTVLIVAGDVDVYSAVVLREALDRAIGAGRRRFIVDLQGVSFLDSTALGLLVGRMKFLRMQEGSIRIVCSVPRLLRVFGITGLNKVFDVDESLEAALAAEAAATDGSAGEGQLPEGGTPGGDGLAGPVGSEAHSLPDGLRDGQVEDDVAAEGNGSRASSVDMRESSAPRGDRP